jgi:small subunit ribosomal protein S12
MSSLQIIRKPRIQKVKNNTTPKLRKNPQQKAVCLRVLTMSPKKPNSANRRIVKAIITKTKAKLTVKITGEAHTLQQHSTILVKGARVRDLIGVNYSAIRGKFDLAGVPNRKTRRSLFGVKRDALKI